MELLKDIGQPPATSAGLASGESGSITVTRQRKAHKKSHHGCSNCKRRKIKCTESRPVCDGCTKQNLQCVYPPGSHRLAPVRSIVPHMSIVMQINSVPTVLNITDMHLFNHFRATAYPHVPLGNDKVWMVDIARLVQSYDFLAHAVLGLAASHLEVVSTSNLASCSLSHRVLAVKGLNQAFSSTPKKRADADALLATCYALAMQAMYIGESVSEYLIMLRGCHVVIAQQWPQRLGTAFQRLEMYCQLHHSSQKLSALPVLDESKYMPAIESLEKLAPLCISAMEKKVHGYLLDVVLSLKVSSRQACLRYSFACSALPALPEAEFRSLVDPANPVAQILLIHFASILALIYPIKSLEWSNREMGSFNRKTIFRMECLRDIVPPSFQRYIAWPMQATV